MKYLIYEDFKKNWTKNCPFVVHLLFAETQPASATSEFDEWNNRILNAFNLWITPSRAYI